MPPRYLTQPTDPVRSRETMGEMRAVPQTFIEQILGDMGRAAGSARGFMNEQMGIPGIDTGIQLGNLLMGEGPELLEDLSWGKSLIEQRGHGPGLDMRAPDILGMAGLFGGAASLGKSLAKTGIKKAVGNAPQMIGRVGRTQLDDLLDSMSRNMPKKGKFLYDKIAPGSDNLGFYYEGETPS